MKTLTYKTFLNWDWEWKGQQSQFMGKSVNKANLNENPPTVPIFTKTQKRYLY